MACAKGVMECHSAHPLRHFGYAAHVDAATVVGLHRADLVPVVPVDDAAADLVVVLPLVVDAPAALVDVDPGVVDAAAEVVDVAAADFYTADAGVVDSAADDVVTALVVVVLSASVVDTAPADVAATSADDVFVALDRVGLAFPVFVFSVVVVLFAVSIFDAAPLVHPPRTTRKSTTGTDPGQTWHH